MNLHLLSNLNLVKFAKSFKKVFLSFVILVSCLTCLTSLSSSLLITVEAQPSSFTSGNIIEDCSIAKLNPNGNAEKFTDLKKVFFQNCIQGIIRFIVVLSATFAIIRIAIVGLGELNPIGGGNPQIKGAIQNLVIGLALLTMGWYIIPIFNASFSKVDFLSPPAVRQSELQRVAFVNASNKYADDVLANANATKDEVKKAFEGLNCSTKNISEVSLTEVSGKCLELLKKYQNIVEAERQAQLKKEADEKAITLANLNQAATNLNNTAITASTTKFNDVYSSPAPKAINIMIASGGSFLDQDITMRSLVDSIINKARECKNSNLSETDKATCQIQITPPSANEISMCSTMASAVALKQNKPTEINSEPYKSVYKECINTSRPQWSEL
jgi:hypothetical protein